MVKSIWVEFYKCTASQDSEFNPVETWTLYKKVSCKVWEVTGKERYISDRFAKEQGLYFSVDYFKLPDTTGRMKAVFNGTTYILQNADNIGNQNRYWGFYGSAEK